MTMMMMRNAEPVNSAQVEGPSLFGQALALVADGVEQLDAVAELLVAAEGRRLPLLAAYNLAAVLVEHFPNDTQAEIAFNLLGKALHWNGRIELAS